MNNFFGYIAIIVLIIFIGVILFKEWRSDDKSDFWSPMTFISLTFAYYCLMPFFDDEVQTFLSHSPSSYMLFFICLILYFVSLVIGFRVTKPTGNFSNWNAAVNADNCKKVGLILFFFALLLYVPVRGLHFSIGSISDDVIYAERTGPVNYMIEMVNTLCFAASLMIASNKGKKNPWIVLVLWVTIATYIVAGFRGRLVILLISCCTTFYLFPKPRKLDYVPLIALAVGAYLFFAVMEASRSYSRGLDLEKAKEMSFSDMAEGSNENNSVFIFSCQTIDAYSRKDKRIYFEPILTAALMPLPRSVFPWKPDGRYLKEAQIMTIGEVRGAAFFNFVEAYMSFGILGVIIYGFILGWLAKKFWSNYKNNPTSLGAIVALAIFNGFCYKVISRGYLAGIFDGFIFYICIPFWLSIFLNKKILK